MQAHAATSIPRYRQELKRTLPAHYLKADNRHLLWLVPHTGIIAGSLWLMSAWFSWWLAPFLGILIGHSLGCLGFLGHEICHGGAIKNRTLRHLLTGIAFSPFGIGPYLWSRWHNAEHHGNTQQRELDPDRLFQINEYRENAVLKWLYRMSPLARNVVIFGFFSLMMSQHNISMMIAYIQDPKTTWRERFIIVYQFLLPKAFWVLLTVMLGWQILLMGYVLPLLVANALVISYIATNHFLNPLADEDDVLASSLSVTMPRGFRWLDAMHLHFGAHVAHHLFPQATSRHARKIELELKRLWPERFHEMPITHALKLLWDTPWVYDEDGKALIDPERGLSTPTLGHGLDRQEERVDRVA